MENIYDLIEPFDYSLIGITVISIILVLIAAYSSWLCIVKKQKNKIKNNLNKEVKLKNLDDLKEYYLNLILNIEKDLEAEKINIRVAYQKLSSLVRLFVFEATGIEAHKLTLTEIQNINMPSLQALITDFYDPEFAFRSSKNLELSIENTRKVIKQWR